MTELRFLKGIVVLLKVSFLYPIETKSLLIKTMYFSWGCLYAASFITTFIQCLMYLYYNPFNLIQEAMVIMNTVIYCSLFVNFTLLSMKKRKLLKFVQTVNANFVNETDNGTEQVTMDSAYKLSDKFAYFWTINAVSSSLMPTILSLMGGNRILPILEWIPYEHETSPLFELTYIWQFFCLTTLGVIFAALDSVFPCIAIVMGRQFRILASNFRNNLNYANTGVNLDTALAMSSEMQEKNLSYFKKNIKHHQILLTCCQDLNNILGTFLMGKIAAAIFNTLFMAFSLITTRDPALILGLTTYCMATSTELFMYTYSGQILTENSEILWSLYSCPWYLCDLRFQRIFHIVQMRINKSVYVKAGMYFTMSAACYITFMKTLFSYVAILKELTERER